MEAATSLDGPRTTRILRSFRDLLARWRERINQLNVFPVADGDTGTNLYLTMEAVTEALRGLDEAAGLDKVAEVASHASLMAARGNSGVIFSQILRTLLSELARAQGTPEALRSALEAAASAARSAVQHPVEGTILSVASEVARAARQSAEDSLAAIGRAVEEAAWRALLATTSQLDVLAKAQVVDAGGAGLFLFCSALRAELAGGEPRGLEGLSEARVEAVQTQPKREEAPAFFEVMFLLEAPDAKVEAFRQSWASFGDSVVVVGGDGTYSCHIHTYEPGAAIEAALEVGRPRQIRITALPEGSPDEPWVEQAERAKCSLVAVAWGEGMRRIFSSLGAAEIVSSARGAPSVQELASALRLAPAAEVVLLPNSKDVLPAARLAAEQVETKKVAVVETKTQQEGMAAACEYDPTVGAQHNAGRMREAAMRVISGALSRAVRPAEGPDGPIHVGDWLGLVGDEIAVVAPSALEAASALLGKLIRPEHELVTVIVGQDAPEGVVEELTKWIEGQATVGIEVHWGGQPTYALLFGLE